MILHTRMCKQMASGEEGFSLGCSGEIQYLGSRLLALLSSLQGMDQLSCSL